jgi:hypothetical protein
MSSCSKSPAKKPGLRPETGEKAVSRAELELLRQKAVDLCREQPEKAAVILTDWIKHPARGFARKKSA